MIPHALRLAGQRQQQEGASGGGEGAEEAARLPVLQGAHGASSAPVGEGHGGGEGARRPAKGGSHRRRRPAGHEHRAQGTPET